MSSQAETDTPIIDDTEIKRRVESIAGKNARVVDCEKKSSFVSEETLLINGVPVRLEGKAGERIKEALKSGQPPPVELLSEILVQAGIERNPVQLETTMTVKSSTKTSELSTLRDRHGKLVDEKLKEFEEDDEIQTASVEIWEKDSDEAAKLKKTMDDFRANMEPFIIPKPLPRTTPYSPDRTPPKTPQSSPSSATPPSPATPPPPPTTPPNNQYYYYEAPKSQQQQFFPNSNINNKQRPSEPPPRIPSLLRPFKLSNGTNNNKPKPIPPPKPNKAKQVAYQNHNTNTNNTNTSDALRREKNFELPVRVVYETFI